MQDSGEPRWQAASTMTSTNERHACKSRANHARGNWHMARGGVDVLLRGGGEAGIHIRQYCVLWGAYLLLERVTTCRSGLPTYGMRLTGHNVPSIRQGARTQCGLPLN